VGVLILLSALVPAALGNEPQAHLDELPPRGGTGIEPEIEQIQLRGVDRAARRDGAALAPTRQGRALEEVGLDAEALDDQPELLTAAIDADDFDAVGISWDRAAGPAPAVWVRVEEDEDWSDWELLPPLDIGPDADSDEGRRDSGRVFSEPLLTNGATELQVRIDAPNALSDVRADLIDAGDSEANGVRGATGRSPGLQLASATAEAGTTATGGRSAAVASRPPIITRAQWGADESLRSGEPAYSASIKVGVVHHTATTNSYSASTASAQIRSIYAYHTRSLGWSDIAYNFLVDRDGRVYEGRYGGVDRAVLSAATGGFNRYTFSVSALGNYDEVGPPGAMVESIAQLMAWKFAIHYADPNGTSELTSAGADTARYPAGQTVTVPNVMAHRDTNVTGCPGRYLYAEMDYLRYRVKELVPAGLDHPSSRTVHRTPTSNGSVRVTSGMLYGGTWSLTVTDASGAFVHRLVGWGHAIDVTWPMVSASGAPVPEGTYHLRLLTDQNGSTGHPFDIRVSTSGFIGNFEGVGVTPNGVIAVGWAAVSSGGVATIALVTDGGDVVRSPADQFRPDVGAVYPELGPYRGFSGLRGMTVGRHLVCAWAESPGLESALLGCRLFDNPPNEPIGHVDSVAPTYGGVRVSGWMLDRHSSDPITTRIYVDGRYGGDWRADRDRPDIAAVFPAYGPSHGFVVDVPAAPGQHTLCVNGLNVGPGPSEGHVGCVQGSPITGLPIGQLDGIGVAPGSISVSGWTFDPDTTDPINVHVYVDGAYRGAFPANVDRPDLRPHFPLMGAAHGFEATVGGVGLGRHTVCVYAISAGPPGDNPLLGCRTTS
jgi:hypothetical protein